MTTDWQFMGIHRHCGKLSIWPGSIPKAHYTVATEPSWASYLIFAHLLHNRDTAVKSCVSRGNTDPYVSSTFSTRQVTVVWNVISISRIRHLHEGKAVHVPAWMRDVHQNTEETTITTQNHTCWNFFYIPKMILHRPVNVWNPWGGAESHIYKWEMSLHVLF